MNPMHEEYYSLSELEIITDSQFINFKNLSNEDISIIYEVMLNGALGCSPYDVIVYHYNLYKTPIGRKVILKHWGDYFQYIIEKLEAYNRSTIKGSWCVYIPFLNEYKRSSQYTIKLFKMAKDATELIRELDGEKLQMEKAESLIVVGPMSDLFQKWKSEVLNEGDMLKAEVIDDEMMRRGIILGEPKQSREKYWSLCISSKKQDNDYYKEEGRTISKVEKAGVLYYMLRDCADDSLIYKVLHYVLNTGKQFKGADANDTIYTYIKHPERFLTNNKMWRIVDILDAYHFPDEVIEKIKEEGWRANGIRE